jgi:membrane-bound serine protease (ClpP class)
VEAATLIFLSSYTLEVLPMNWYGLALILLAFVILIVDLNVTNHGLPTIGGIVALTLGVLLLFDVTAPYFWALLIVFMTVVILVGILFARALGDVLKDRGKPATTGVEGMVGEVGVVTEPVRANSSGWIFVHGERWRAIAAIAPEDAHKQDQEQAIGVGQRVQVVGFRDGKVIVLPFGSPTSGRLPKS